MSIFFTAEGKPWKITATNTDDAIAEGWYNIDTEEDLKYVCIPALHSNMDNLLYSDIATLPPYLSTIELKQIETYFNSETVIAMIDGFLNKL